MAEPCKDHLGNEYPSIEAMLKHYGLARTTFWNRINRAGWSLERALTEPAGSGGRPRADKSPVTDHLGNEYPDIKSLCKAYGVPYSTYSDRTSRLGWDKKKALTTPTGKRSPQPCKDHLGNEFPSKEAMLRHYGIPKISLDYRLSKGWSLEKALTTPKGDTRFTTAMECEDHLGNKFKSKKDMCEYWHVPRALFFRRIKTPGWDLERALTQPIVKQHVGAKRNLVTGPDGKTYWNIDEMCAEYGITKTQYMTNIRNGLSVADALVERTEVQKHPKDHLGNEFRSTNAMCAHYGITKTVLRARLELGWSLEQILTSPQKNLHYIESVDHEGRVFKNQKEMLKFHGISYAKFKHRIKQGLPPEQALSPHSLHEVKCRDHHGNEFDTLADMLEYWMAKTGSYHKLGHIDLQAALLGVYRSIPLPPGIKVKKRLEGGYYLIKIGKDEYVWSDLTLFACARKFRLDEHIKAAGPSLREGLVLKDTYENAYDIVLDGNPMIVSADALYRLVFLKSAFPSREIVPEIVPDGVPKRPEIAPAHIGEKRGKIPATKGAKSRRKGKEREKT